MIKSVFKKSLPFKSYSKNSELPSKKILIKMSTFVLQRYLCYKYWAMCYEVFLMCYNRSPKIKALRTFLILLGNDIQVGIKQKNSNQAIQTFAAFLKDKSLNNFYDKIRQNFRKYSTS